MIEYPDNLIGKDSLSPLDLECRNKLKLAPGWLPIETYDLVQCGYPRVNHGEMILRPDGGTNKQNELLSPNGMWVKSEEVRRIIQYYEDRINSKTDTMC